MTTKAELKITNVADEKLQWDMQCYGCSEQSIRNDMVRVTDYTMAVASLMSDAQQEIEFGDDERARQTLNRAKFILFNYVMNDE